MSLTASQIFEEVITNRLKEKADKIDKINTVYEFVLKDTEGEVWTMDLTVPGGKISKGSSGNAKCTVTITTQHLSDIVEKKLNPQMAFITGKLKVAGDMGLALKLGSVL